MTLTDGTPYDTRTQAEIDANTARAIEALRRFFRTGWRPLFPWVLGACALFDFARGGEHLALLISALVVLYGVRAIEKGVGWDA